MTNQPGTKTQSLPLSFINLSKTVQEKAHKQSQPLVIVLLGPTASGKTALAIDLAEQLQLSLINVDSRQLYVGMDIGTAKPTIEQQQRIPHHLLNLRRPDQPITLHEFQAKALPIIDQAIQEQGMAFLVGGSGLYLKALTAGLCPPAVPPNPTLRNQLSMLGQPICHGLLKQADPCAGARIALADMTRTQRALEVLYATGRPMSDQQICIPPHWDVLELGLDPPDLKERIGIRTTNLYEAGLIDETKNLCQNYGPDLPLLQTIGYGEALKVIEGVISQTEAIQQTTRRTRQFAKRQRTWFRRQHHPHWLKSQDQLQEAMTLIKAGLGLELQAP